MMIQFMNKISFLLIFFLLILLPASGCSQPINSLRIGADIFFDDEINLLSGKRVALIVNHTSLLSNKTHVVDSLYTYKDINIQKLFAPEHGIRGNVDAGKHITDDIDPVTGIKIVSLYGPTKKPTSEMLANIDVLIFDIQDVGARYYTFISTLYYVIEAAAENNKQIIVLDRPNPIGGEKVEGPILEKEYKSFVGITEIPIRHGMTIGELAFFFNDDIKIKQNISADLKVIKMKNWDRKKYFDEYFSDWLPPSPNINTLETAVVYPGTCLIEGTNLSEGRGTYEPFIVFGAPFINSEKVITELYSFAIKGVKLEPVSFIPISIKGMSESPKLKNIECYGIRLVVTERDDFSPLEFGVKFLSVITKLYPDKIKFNIDFFDKLAGTDKIRKMILDKQNPDIIIQSWQNDLKDFLIKRNEYLLY